MAEALQLVGEYGITLVLLLASLYVLYRFVFFSINEVKQNFEKRHEELHKDMDEIKRVLTIIEAYIKTKEK